MGDAARLFSAVRASGANSVEQYLKQPALFASGISVTSASALLAQIFLSKPGPIQLSNGFRKFAEAARGGQTVSLFGDPPPEPVKALAQAFGVPIPKGREVIDVSDFAPIAGTKPGKVKAPMMTAPGNKRAKAPTTGISVGKVSVRTPKGGGLADIEAGRFPGQFIDANLAQLRDMTPKARAAWFKSNKPRKAHLQQYADKLHVPTSGTNAEITKRILRALALVVRADAEAQRLGGPKQTATPIGAFAATPPERHERMRWGFAPKAWPTTSPTKGLPNKIAVAKLTTETRTGLRKLVASAKSIPHATRLLLALKYHRDALQDMASAFGVPRAGDEKQIAQRIVEAQQKINADNPPVRPEPPAKTAAGIAKAAAVFEPKGDWQHAVLRDLVEGRYPVTAAGLLKLQNGYADELDGGYGEGTTPEGRKHLRKLLNAAEGMLERHRKKPKRKGPKPAMWTPSQLFHVLAGKIDNGLKPRTDMAELQKRWPGHTRQEHEAKLAALVADSDLVTVPQHQGGGWELSLIKQDEMGITERKQAFARPLGVETFIEETGCQTPLSKGQKLFYTDVQFQGARRRYCRLETGKSTLRWVVVGTLQSRVGRDGRRTDIAREPIDRHSKFKAWFSTKKEAQKGLAAFENTQATALAAQPSDTRRTARITLNEVQERKG
jgi:hypothetical protein